MHYWLKNLSIFSSRLVFYRIINLLEDQYVLLIFQYSDLLQVLMLVFVLSPGQREYKVRRDVGNDRASCCLATRP